MAISARQAELIEEAAVRLMREGGRDVDAMHLMTVKLAWMWAPEVQPAVPSNVVRLELRPTDSGRV